MDHQNKHAVIANILNDLFEHDSELHLGVGQLLPLPKPKKTPGLSKSLCPITLLEILRKILSKILMNRTSSKIDTYLSKSQSAHRKGRSTTDIIWAYR